MNLFSILLALVAIVTPQSSTPLSVWGPRDLVVSRNVRTLLSLSVWAKHPFGLHGSLGAVPQNESTATAQANGNAKIEGIVRDTVPHRGPVPNALVRMFPDPDYLQRPELIRTTRTDEWGNFVIENVVPGKYRVIALMGGGPEDLHGEATIAAAAGTRVTLSEKESKTLTLYIYLAHR